MTIVAGTCITSEKRRRQEGVGYLQCKCYDMRLLCSRCCAGGGPNRRFQTQVQPTKNKSPAGVQLPFVSAEGDD